jgi:hypothetical protein
MPRQKRSQTICICGRHRSNHRFLERGLGPSYDGLCSGFKTHAQARAEKAEARHKAMVEALRQQYKKDKDP